MPGGTLVKNVVLPFLFSWYMYIQYYIDDLNTTPAIRQIWSSLKTFRIRLNNPESGVFTTISFFDNCVDFVWKEDPKLRTSGALHNHHNLSNPALLFAQLLLQDQPEIPIRWGHVDIIHSKSSRKDVVAQCSSSKNRQLIFGVEERSRNHFLHVEGPPATSCSTDDPIWKQSKASTRAMAGYGGYMRLCSMELCQELKSRRVLPSGKLT